MASSRSTTIGDLLTEFGGDVQTGPFGTKLKAAEYTATGVPVISVGEVGYGRLQLHDKTPRVDATVTERMPEYVLRRGDIVFGRKGAVDRCAQVRPEQDGWFLGSDGIRLRLPSSCDSTFIAYQLQLPSHRSWMLQHAAGSTMPSLNEGIVRRIPILLPGIDEQRAITAVLAALDDKIEQNRKTERALEGLARATFKAWFVDFEPVKAKAAGQKGFPGMPPAAFAALPNRMTDSPLGPVPQGWDIRPLEYCVSQLIDHRGKTPKKLGGDWAERGIPALSAKNVKAGRIIRSELNNFVDDEMFGRWMPVPLALKDIVMTSEAPLGELVYLARNADYCLSQRVFGIRANREVIEPSYLYCFLESDAAQSQLAGRASGTTVIGIRQSELRKIDIPVPPIAIQRAAAEILQTCADLAAQLDESTDKLAALRDYLLPRLLSGRVRVTQRRGDNDGDAEGDVADDHHIAAAEAG